MPSPLMSLESSANPSLFTHLSDQFHFHPLTSRQLQAEASRLCSHAFSTSVPQTTYPFLLSFLFFSATSISSTRLIVRHVFAATRSARLATLADQRQLHKHQ